MKYDGINPIELLEEGEPYFFLRGKDVHAIETLEAYAKLLRADGDSVGGKELQEMQSRFLTWQLSNPDMVRAPDVHKPNQGPLISGVPRNWFMYPDDPMNPEERKIARLVFNTACKVVGEIPFQDGTFATPSRWKERKELHGLQSKLIICHDGGDMTHILGINDPTVCADKFTELMEGSGYYVEGLTNWYSAIYPT